MGTDFHLVSSLSLLVEVHPNTANFLPNAKTKCFDGSQVHQHAGSRAVLCIISQAEADSLVLSDYLFVYDKTLLLSLNELIKTPLRDLISHIGHRVDTG